MNVRSVANPADKLEILRGFDPRSQTWLVPDLQSKLEIQKRLLAESPLLEEDAVLRASEFWTKLAARSFPEWRPIGYDLTLVLLSERLTHSPYAWARTPGASVTLYHYMDQLLPVLANPNGVELVEQWMQDRVESQLRWRHWLLLAEETWGWLQEKSLIPSSWVKGLLLNQEIEPNWPRSIVADLGVELSPAELELLRQLDRQQSVTLIQPPRISRLCRRAERIYEMAGSNRLAEVPPLAEVKGIHRFRTVVAEVKAVIATTRSWLEAGIPAHQIAWLAPDVEEFWPVLRSYAEIEGIPVAKPWLTRSQSFPGVARWLADLRVKIKTVSSGDLELSLFGVEKPEVDYARFFRLLSQIYEDQDLERWPEVAKRFKMKPSGERLLRDEFLLWLVDQEQDVDWSEDRLFLLQALLQETPANLSLRPKDWLNLIERLAAKSENEMLAGQARGVRCLNLRSAEWLSVERAFVMGLTDRALSGRATTAITAAEISALAQDLGFYLAHPDETPQDFEARWFFSKRTEEVHVSFSESDIGGTSQAPSGLWLEMARGAGRPFSERSSSGLTRWDEIQRTDLAQLRKVGDWSATHADLLEKGMLTDLGVCQAEPFAAGLPFKMSASLIEDFYKCPFIAAAKKAFRLSDEEAVDLETGVSTQGRLAHEVCRRLCQEPLRFDYSMAELRELIEQVVVDLKIVFGHPELARLERQHLVKMAQRFLQCERDWRRRFPATKTQKGEVKIRAKWSEVTQNFVSVDSSEAGVEWSGSIDRVDEGIDGRRIVIDYKRSDGEVANFETWLRNGRIQLAFYVYALERGLSELDPGPVDGAFYYVLQDMNRNTGWGLRGTSSGLFDEGAVSSRALMAVEKKELWFAEFVNFVREQLTAMRTGNFRPEPKKIEDCEKCRWRGLCRAPHLN